MGAEKIRHDLQALLEQIQDEHFLRAVYVMMKEYSTTDQEIIGYTVSGEPLTKEAYNKRLEEAERQIEAGNYLTQEEVEKEAENW